MQQYDFSDALRLMKEGKKVRRLKTDNPSTYLYYGLDTIWHQQNPTCAESQVWINTESILATDWIIYEG